MNRWEYTHTFQKFHPQGNLDVRQAIDRQLSHMGGEGWELIQVAMLPLGVGTGSGGGAAADEATAALFWKREAA